MTEIELSPIALNVEASGWTTKDINPELLLPTVGAYSALQPTSLIGYSNDSVGGVFVRMRSKRYPEAGGNEIFRIVDNRVVTEVTDLCSGSNLGCNISNWVSTSSGAVFCRDIGGSEAPDLWEGLLTISDNGASKWKFFPLISNESTKIKVSSVKVSNDELTMVFTWNKRNPQFADLYTWKRTVKSSSWRETNPVLVYESSGYTSPAGFTSDGNRLIIFEVISSSEQKLFFADIHQDGTISELQRFNLPEIDSEKQYTFNGLSNSKSNPSILYLSTNAYSDMQALVQVNLIDSTVKHITTPNLSANHTSAIYPITWEVSGCYVVGEKVLFSANEDGKDVLYIFDSTSETVKPVIKTPIGVLEGISIDKKSQKISIVYDSPSHPSQLYEFDIETLSFKPYQVGVSKIDSENDGTVEPELIRYASFDGTSISAFLYLPPKEKISSSMPVLLYIHGGPSSQYQPRYLPGNHPLSLRYLTDEMGIACIAPNIRGSSGYGTAFMEADDRLKREDALKDIESLVDWVKTQAHFDSSRIGIMGRSYGGWAVLAAVMYFPTLFKCGLATCGISNYLTFFENTGPWRAEHRRKEYGDERIPEERKFLIKISPALHPESIKVPMYLGIGENDTRVPLGEAIQMTNVIRKQGGDVWLFIGKKEGHVFTQKSVKDYHAIAQVAFLAKFLL
ncbi:hypothetical protein HK100_002232 [Physocladia obscura]|uniref:Prolyl endopeptidase n=1 Tax=Physocladia obscura TaxID=109957 RepID=A0AAD5XE03_9FUNG|nr:hypothetical protein HK100_002232 [Physocladia obscura]